MRFPEQLYRLAGRAALPGGVVAELQVLARNAAFTGTAATINLDDTNPDDNYAWVVTNVAGDATSAGAELINRQTLRLVTPALDTTLVTFQLKRDETDSAAAGTASIDWQGEVIVLPRWRVRYTSVKSAGVGSTTLTLSLLGYRLPLANITR